MFGIWQNNTYRHFYGPRLGGSAFSPLRTTFLGSTSVSFNASTGMPSRVSPLRLTVKFLHDDPVDGVVVPDVQPDQDWAPKIILSSEKSQRIFNTKYRPIAQTVRDTVACAVKLGWVQ
jgi:hypothetical protein